MAAIVLVETNGTLKTLKTKEVTLDTLYKKCGYRGNDDFKLRHTWKVKLPDASTKYNISVWAKTNGKANFENKYDFPPPIDKELYFGTCAIVRTSASASGTSAAGTSAAMTSVAGASEEETILDLTKEMWEKIYEELFGGFEDIGSQDEYSEDELADADPSTLTSHGYLKDDFVVSDKEEITPAPSPPPTEAPMKKKITKKKKETNVVVSDGTNAVDTGSDSTNAVLANAVGANAVLANAVVTKKPKRAKKQVVSESESNSEETPSELEEETYNYSDEE